MPKQIKISIARIALKGVSRKLFRNLVLILAVGMLVALLTFARLFNKAVNDDLEAANKRLGADIVMVPVEAMDKAEEFILESKEKTFYMDKKIFDEVKNVPGVAAATYEIYLKTLASGCCSIVDGQVVAIDQKTDFIVRAWLNENTPPLKQGEAYVGSYVYEYLGLIDTPTLFGHPVKVVAHLKKSGTGLDHALFIRQEDLDLVSAAALGKYDRSKISLIFIKIKPGYDLDDMADKLQTIAPTTGIMTRGTLGASVRATLSDITSIFSITIIISSVLAILLAWSTFTAMANERQREVGILRAIGAQRRHIFKLFLGEALIISFFGGLIGVVLGHELISFLAADFHIIKELHATTAITPGNILVSLEALGVGILVCLTGALLPVIRLANMEPLEAIKEE
ncbi:MAG TPA: ABC transporter permease [Desulfobacterales bacterium]|nr:ABC transporter permease [Desulfobacterales bacterium]